MRTRILLILMVLVMSGFVVTTPFRTVKLSAADALLEIKRHGYGGQTELLEADRTGLAGLTALDAREQTSEPNKPQLSSDGINPELLDSLGIKKPARRSDTSKANRHGIRKPVNPSRNSLPRPQSGQPQVLNDRSALSAALITSIGGRDNQFSEVTLLADWDGREDCVADRELKIDDISGSEVEIDETTTRVAISEHTIANGFNENVFYHGGSTGRFCICVTAEGCPCLSLEDLINGGHSGGLTLLNPIQGDCADDQITITGIAVSPVADLGDFGLCNTIGEVVYVSTLDPEGCSTNAANQPFRTRIFALGFIDVPGGVAPVGAIQILRSPLSNIAGLAVDDDGNLYFQLVDLINLQNGAAIFKVTETPRTVEGCGANPRINRVVSSIPDGLTGNIGLSTANPVLTSGGFRLTNYSGQSLTFGNVVSLATGASNVLYAAVARSLNPADTSFARATEGAFPSPAAFGPTPSMIISFADCSGAFDSCSSPAPGTPGTLPIADGIADIAQGGLVRIPGINNFRVFALGNGPDIRPTTEGTAAVPATPASLLKLDMQIDFTIHSGIVVNEEGTVFVISGGTPAGVGNNPSPHLGEILCFEDTCPIDRRADFVDFRGDVLPNPPDSGGNSGDGDSDRFDHIFHDAPLDQVTFTPAGLSGLARGFLRFTNRLAPNPISPGVTLGVSGGQTVQGDDDTSGPIIFENLDPGHQVAGGDNQNPPFTGDDNDGFANPNTPNNPALVGPLYGGFEFLFGAAGVPGSTTTPCINNVWNAFFLNSNGSVTFSGGDPDPTPTVPAFRSGLPKIAPAWANLNPDSRTINPINFPAQALGYANVNAFRVRWLNVPESGREGCSTNAFGIGSNTFGVTLYDDGIGLDENVAIDPSVLMAELNKADKFCRGELVRCLLRTSFPTGGCIDFYQGCIKALGTAEVPTEGPVIAITVTEPNTGQRLPCQRRDEGTGPFNFDYGRMDLLGTPDRPVITGYSEGGASPLDPPGLCETNLSTAASRSDTSPFGVIDGQTASIEACLIGQSTEPHIFELFDEGRDARIGAGGEITFATPDFDFRFEGNDPALCTPVRQRDFNRGKVGFLGKTCPPDPLGLLVTPRGRVPVAPGQVAVDVALCCPQGGQSNPDGSSTLPPGCLVPFEDSPCGAGDRVVCRGGRTNPDGSTTCSEVTIGISASPSTRGIINALCDVRLNVLGCGFFPNETTTICGGFSPETGVPVQRPGKTVSTSGVITCDTNGDGVADGNVSLTNVTPINRNLVRVTLPALSGSGLPGTPFPLTCCGGITDLTLTTTFTPGDNNQFGLFTRTTTVPIDLGVRAPVVISATPSGGNCAVPQDLLISGACFIAPLGSVTSVFAVERSNPTHVVEATNFVVLNSNLIDALFDFGTANAGKTFTIFVTGPGGTSRNLTTLPQGAQPGCPLGNEQGVQVNFTCDPADLQSSLPVVSACNLKRSPAGAFSLVVNGRNFKQGATATVGGKTPKKVQFKNFQADSNSYDTLVLKRNICGGIPGVVVVTNPDGKSSLPFQCGGSCSAQN